MLKFKTAVTLFVYCYFFKKQERKEEREEAWKYVV